jgi:hypothetical protein
MQTRIDMMVLGDKKTRNYLSFRLGQQLLQIGDEASALIAFESEILPQTKSQAVEPTIPDYSCEQCFADKAPFLYCKTCPFSMLCPECWNKQKWDKIPWCQGHEFLRVPGLK